MLDTIILILVIGVLVTSAIGVVYNGTIIDQQIRTQKELRRYLLEKDRDND